MKKPIPRKATIDGLSWPHDLEDQINGAFRSALSGPAGETVIDYLRAITTDTVLGPGASDAHLRTQEGMRQLFRIIETRRKSEPT